MLRNSLNSDRAEIHFLESETYSKNIGQQLYGFTRNNRKQLSHMLSLIISLLDNNAVAKINKVIVANDLNRRRKNTRYLHKVEPTHGLKITGVNLRENRYAKVQSRPRRDQCFLEFSPTLESPVKLNATKRA